jgi:hypothetical protein
MVKSTRTPAKPEYGIATLRTSHSSARQKIAEALAKASELSQTIIRNEDDLAVFDSVYEGWFDRTKQLLAMLFSTPEESEKFNDAGKYVGHSFSSEIGSRAEGRMDTLRAKRSSLESLEGRLDLFQTAGGTLPSRAPEMADIITSALRRFEPFIRQLQKSSRGRDPFLFRDEYDVQYVLKAVLNLLASDVRSEEYTPSFAGSSARMDFILKEHGIVVEAKKTRDSLTEREIGNELIQDIGRYSSHPDCHTLICFVYDPDRHIDNPVGLERDLSGKQGRLDVRVLVVQ